MQVIALDFVKKIILIKQIIFFRWLVDEPLTFYQNKQYNRVFTEATIKVKVQAGFCRFRFLFGSVCLFVNVERVLRLRRVYSSILTLS